MSRQVVKAEMPGSILSLSCEAGSTVTSGQELLVMESMKMEMSIFSPADGTVIEWMVSPGQSVVDGQDLVAVQA